MQVLRDVDIIRLRRDVCDGELPLREVVSAGVSYFIQQKDNGMGAPKEYVARLMPDGGLEVCVDTSCGVALLGYLLRSSAPEVM